MITRTDEFVAYARARAAAAHAAAELADHPRDKAALKAAARLWERIAGPAVSWSTKDLSRDLTALKRAVTQATGPFQPPKPPKSAPVAVDIHSAAAVRARFQARAAQEATIEF
jgi:hypothetical protein